MLENLQFERSAGILLPVSALPSDYGIGAFDDEAYRFIDFLTEAKQKYWQVLPLGSTGYGDSPYQSFSSFAGNPYFISLPALADEGLLDKSLLSALDNDAGDIDYSKLFYSRFDVLKKAFSKFIATSPYYEFCEENAWLEDYSLFMALKTTFSGSEWQKWPDELKRREPSALKTAKTKLADEIEFWKFCQYTFFSQWKKLKSYSNEKGIRIIGDIPIYAAMDSSDTWAEPDIFYLDEELDPIDVAGCPPDGFSKNGQLWGNPLYRWDYQRETGFEWWKRRLKAAASLYDVIRLDHFRGIESYFAIPARDSTAQHGVWRKGPGIDFFDAVYNVISNTKFIMEDLGFLDQSVRDLLSRIGAPGMKVLLFAFDSREKNDYLPHNYIKNSVVYTGTHDNSTVVGWYSSSDKHDTAYAKEYLNAVDDAQIHWFFIRAAYASVSSLAVVPIQDFLGLCDEARINIPSKLGGNWKWRLKRNDLSSSLAKKISGLITLYGR